MTSEVSCSWFYRSLQCSAIGLCWEVWDLSRVWEWVAYVCLALTVAGQVLTASNVLVAQWVWLVSNLLFVVRDVALQRPTADKVKDVSMLALTIGMVVILSI